MTLEINYKKKPGKMTNMWRQNNMLLKHQWIIEEIKGEIKKYLKTNEKDNKTTLMGCSKSSSKKEIHSNTSTAQQTRKIPNK